DCDGDPANGCEVDLISSGAHCGDCHVACGAPSGGGTVACVAALCVAGCPLGATLCGAGANGGGACVDTTIDTNHCGSCSTVCPVPGGGIATCSAGLCGTMCTLGVPCSPVAPGAGGPTAFWAFEDNANDLTGNGNELHSGTPHYAPGALGRA